MDVSAVHAALSDKSYSDLAPLCDELFLQAASRGAATDDWPYAVHLLAHLYLNDLNSARFLWKSLPQEVKDARPELAAVWRIGQCLWNRDYTLVYTATQGFEWGPELADFVTAFLERYRKRIFQLLTSAYSTISVADVAHFMGMSEEDATNYAVQNGWSLDAATKMLTVKKPKEMNMLGEADQPGNQLDDYITRLSSILSQKAAGIVDLQARLEQFQKRLNENNVLLYA